MNRFPKPQRRKKASKQFNGVKRGSRVTKAYNMSEASHESLLLFAEKNRVTVGSCMEVAIAEFLERHQTPTA